MAVVPTPPTFVDGPSSSSQMNQLRDVCNFLLGPPTARVKNSAAQSIPNAAATAITWNGEDWDTDAIHDIAANTSRLTCKTAGKYRIWAMSAWALNGTGRRVLIFCVNGVEVERENRAANSESNAIVMFEKSLAVDDYVELKGYQDSGGALNWNPATSAALTAFMGMTWFSS